ncbi:hypothetical protein RN001_001415 [Aquatica leii]|uniref:Uncharacterized protein n=1 Tax=Aquatica leii TaxID=1421715 RepID=A0AAN7PFZ1_9COLE|nr:hypothetical protein RN001_001415 [Aquatica leii]
MDVCSLQERIEFLMTYIKSMSCQEIVRNFTAAHSDGAIHSKTTILKLQEFLQYGCDNYSHTKRVGTPTVNTEELKLNVVYISIYYAVVH